MVEAPHRLRALIKCLSSNCRTLTGVMYGGSMNYLSLLEQSYIEVKFVMGADPDLGRLEYLAQDIFNFTTYENIISTKMAEKALQVCKAISDGKTFSYINNEEGNLWYLLMVNMPFFENKISWGTSIRGAWWSGSYDVHAFDIESTGLYYGEEQFTLLELNKDQWKEFIEAMIKFLEN